MELKRAEQSSESIELAIFLTLSGGLMDAYSYIARGHVFANAQTGNLLLLSVKIAAGEWGSVMRYVAPVVSFAVGIALAYGIKLRATEKRFHWRQIALVAEILLLALVALIPENMNLLANSMTSFACGIQVQAFRKLHSRVFATTMCIGNLRSGTQELVAFVREGRPDQLEGALLHYGTILCFVIGAVLGSWLISTLGLGAILGSPLLLLGGLMIMFVDREDSDS